MNGAQRIIAVLAGDWPDRRPVMLHNFMMAAREAGMSMRRFRSSPEALAQAFIQSVEKYGYDGDRSPGLDHMGNEEESRLITRNYVGAAAAIKFL